MRMFGNSTGKNGMRSQVQNIQTEMILPDTKPLKVDMASSSYFIAVLAIISQRLVWAEDGMVYHMTILEHVSTT